ncbi:MAG: PqqD family protein [Candidatus Electrothrix aestuarii]|uniref:PqqD family protein n=1 Tax=Candidatus Electrothrix aestuarii TaxID=3062594 RepID=A0AAU8LYK5_9BACT|nr:PqqD family protein [Candidatus Electrothrix aestuarii]
MDIQLTSVLRQAENIVTRTVMGETLLVPISGDLASMDELYTLNDAGSYIWQALNGENSLAEIHEQMKEEYEAPSEIIESDLLEIVRDFADAGLIVAET